MFLPPTPPLNSLRNICLEVKLFGIDQFPYGCLESQNFFKLVFQKNVNQEIEIRYAVEWKACS